MFFVVGMRLDLFFAVTMLGTYSAQLNKQYYLLSLQVLRYFASTKDKGLLYHYYKGFNVDIYIDSS
jgi:hypothetical protein